MSGFSEYSSMDGVGLGELVRNKEVSPSELVEEAISRIERLNPQLNAVIHTMYDEARRLAKSDRGDGPFAGVPFLIKDLLASYAGQPMSSGSRFYGDWAPDHNSELVNRFLASGAIPVGKTNTPEFGLMPTTEPERFGPSRNPWDPERTTGGSSGGSAAAVASRMVPLASGGDGGGSIRIPSACCGLFGLKPSRGRNPWGPDESMLWHGSVAEHVLTRSVRDSAAMLDATAGADAGAPFFAPSPERPYLEEVSREPGRLRIAYSAHPYIPAEVHPDALAALEDAVGLLRDLGHEVVEGSPKIDGEEFARSFLIMIASETYATIRDAERDLGKKATRRDVEQSTWLLRIMSEAFNAGELAVATRTLHRISRQAASYVEQYDVQLNPTLATPPGELGWLKPKGVDAVAQRVLGQLSSFEGRFSPGGKLSTAGLFRAIGALDKAAAETFSFIPYTSLFNVTGQPSMSVPLYWNSAGLPLGVMMTSRFGGESLLFQLAGQLEQARPWADRRPPLS